MSALITNPKNHFDVVSVTKSGDTTFNIPWNTDIYDTFFEIKDLNLGNKWYQLDTLRGVTKYLSSNSTDAEVTDANVLSINGSVGTLKSTLPNGNYFVTLRRAGLISARQTNTSGSITSTVSANTTSGFSIVLYTGTGANATVGHGLGIVPNFIQFKQINGVLGNWGVYHSSLGATIAGSYNLNVAPSASPTHFNNTAPTSSVFSIGTSNDVNTSASYNYVAYCHAGIPGFSKFGSYTGNANANGPFINFGFKPKWVQVKNSSASNHWWIWDSARNIHNPMNNALVSNLTVIEQTPLPVDFVSNGFKLRTTNGEMNGSSNIYIYMAFAEHPFGGANVLPATAR